MFEVNIFETKITEIIFKGNTKYFRDVSYGEFGDMYECQNKS